MHPPVFITTLEHEVFVASLTSLHSGGLISLDSLTQSPTLSGHLKVQMQMCTGRKPGVPDSEVRPLLLLLPQLHPVLYSCHASCAAPALLILGQSVKTSLEAPGWSRGGFDGGRAAVKNRLLKVAPNGEHVLSETCSSSARPLCLCLVLFSELFLAQFTETSLAFSTHIPLKHCGTVAPLTAGS